MIVLGLDPGGTSGCVLAQVEGVEVVTVPEWHETNQTETSEWLFSQLASDDTGQWAVDIVVCETFKPRGGKAIKFQPYSLELIGLVRGLCWVRNIPVIWQDPVIKNTYHKAALEQFPEVGRGGGGHARDALAHVLGYAKLQNSRGA